jgi:hypothetical protein
VPDGVPDEGRTGCPTGWPHGVAKQGSHTGWPDGVPDGGETGCPTGGQTVWPDEVARRGGQTGWPDGVPDGARRVPRHFLNATSFLNAMSPV